MNFGRFLQIPSILIKKIPARLLNTQKVVNEVQKHDQPPLLRDLVVNLFRRRTDSTELIEKILKQQLLASGCDKKDPCACPPKDKCKKNKKPDPCSIKKEKKDPCKKKEDPCKKKKDPCKKEDPCKKKKQDPCKKKDPCKKEKADPCKKKDPCAKKSSCGQIVDPCGKKGSAGGAVDPCAKKSSCGQIVEPCGKKGSGGGAVDPCKKKGGSGGAIDPCKKGSSTKLCSAETEEIVCPNLLKKREQYPWNIDRKPKVKAETVQEVKEVQGADIYKQIQLLDTYKEKNVEKMNDIYKNKQYLAYTNTAYYDVNTYLEDHRQPQPNNKFRYYPKEEKKNK